MPNISTFPEDMVPRQFPKKLKQYSVVPMPALPDVSPIFDDENVYPTINLPENSKKWVQEDAFLRTEFSNNFQISTEKRQCSLNKPVQQSFRPKLELNIYEPTDLSRYNDCGLMKQSESRQKESLSNEGRNMTETSLSFSDQRLLQPINSNLDKRSDRFQEIQDYCQMMATYNNQKYVCERQNIEDSPKELEQESLNEQETAHGKQKLRKKPKEEATKDSLVGIIQNQKEHILIEQKQISLQQKQSLMQQNQIFALQRQIHQLEMVAGNAESKSKYLENIKPTTPVKNNGSLRKFRSSAGVTNQDRLQGLNSSETARNYVNKSPSKLNQCNLSVISYREYVNSTLKISAQNPTIAGCETTHNTAYGCVSLIPDNDTSITAQNLIYEESNINCAYFGGSMNEIEDSVDSSFSSNMQDMNQSCQVSNLASKSLEQGPRLNRFNAKRTDQFSVTTSPDVYDYDYLIRHRLL